MAVYVLTDSDDARILEIVTRALESENVEISSTADDELTESEWRKIDAHNSIKMKTYIGRIVGNTQRMEKDIRSLVDQFAPVSLFFANALAEQEEAKRAKARSERLAREEAESAS